MSVGKNIQAARKSRKMTQNELASRSGISRSYLGDLEVDRYNPSVETLVRLAKALSTEAGSLMEGILPSERPGADEDQLSAFRRREFMGLTPDEVESLAKIAVTLKKARGAK